MLGHVIVCVALAIIWINYFICYENINIKVYLLSYTLHFKIPFILWNILSFIFAIMMKTIVWWSTILCTMSAIWSSLLEERAACEYHLSLTKYPKDQRVLFSFCYLLFALGSDHMTTKYPKDQRMLFSFCYLSFAQRFIHIYHLYYKSKNQRVLFAIKITICQNCG